MNEIKTFEDLRILPYAKAKNDFMFTVQQGCRAGLLKFLNEVKDCPEMSFDDSDVQHVMNIFEENGLISFDGEGKEWGSHVFTARIKINRSKILHCLFLYRDGNHETIARFFKYMDDHPGEIPKWPDIALAECLTSNLLLSERKDFIEAAMSANGSLPGYGN